MARIRVRSLLSVTDMKARQVAKMRELRGCLIAEGHVHLDSQAAALGLPRSTTWTILNGIHKGSGLSADIVARMLAVSNLSPAVRDKILEYCSEKSAGYYGGSEQR